MGCGNPTSVPLLGGCCPAEGSSFRYVSAIRFRYGFAGFSNRSDPIGPRIQMWNSYLSRSTYTPGFMVATAEETGSIDKDTGARSGGIPVVSPNWNNAPGLLGVHEFRYTVTKTTRRVVVMTTPLGGGAQFQSFESFAALLDEQDSTIGWVDSIVDLVNAEDVNAVPAGYESILEADGSRTLSGPGGYAGGNGMLVAFSIPAGAFPEEDRVDISEHEFSPFVFNVIASSNVVYARKARWIDQTNYLRERERLLRGIAGYPFSVPAEELNVTGACRMFDPNTVVISPAVRLPEANVSLTIFRPFATKTPDPCGLA